MKDFLLWQDNFAAQRDSLQGKTKGVRANNNRKGPSMLSVDTPYGYRGK